MSSVESPLQVMIRHVAVIPRPLNNIQLQNDLQNRTSIDRSASMSNIGGTRSEKCVRLANFAVCIFVLTIDLLLKY